MKYLLFVILSLTILFGCSQNSLECSSPNKIIDNSCCLDENSNDICDNNELIEELDEIVVEEVSDAAEEVDEPEEVQEAVDKPARKLKAVETNWDVEFDKCHSINRSKLNGVTMQKDCFISTALMADNILICDTEIDLEYRGDCFYEFAKKRNNSDLCIKSGTNSSICSYDFAMQNQDVELCANSGALGSECYLHFALKTNNTDLCKKLTDVKEYPTSKTYQIDLSGANIWTADALNYKVGKDPQGQNLMSFAAGSTKENCYYRLAIGLNRTEVCNKLKGSYKDICRGTVALNMSICDDMSSDEGSEKYKLFCMAKVAENNKDQKICQFKMATDDDLQNICYMLVFEQNSYCNSVKNPHLKNLCFVLS